MLFLCDRSRAIYTYKPKMLKQVWASLSDYNTVRTNSPHAIYFNISRKKKWEKMLQPELFAYFYNHKNILSKLTFLAFFESPQLVIGLLNQFLKLLFSL